MALFECPVRLDDVVEALDAGDGRHDGALSGESGDLSRRRLVEVHRRAVDANAGRVSCRLGLGVDAGKRLQKEIACVITFVDSTPT
jgi:hypothetical protein